MNFSFTEEQNLLRDSARAMLDRVATPEYIRRCDVEPHYPYELYQAFVEMGLLRMPFPESVGGRDARVTTITAGRSQMQRNLIAGLLGLKAK
ncbi:acyl-CoA dehydrogenase family protein [Piscinibacter sakaiensis]|uniref:acyl-CoA dehydrogenase family protein n=1 Tax=Piscinibacter sakaiensis TaxID=1547922 RepID=UPI003AACFAB6